MEDEESGDKGSDAEEAADEEIVVEDPASSSQAPGSSPSGAPEAGAA
jgi:hypothetical protein